MAKHNFGIMSDNPSNKQYDEYEPERYQCISICDDYIEPLIPEFYDIPCYWHTLRRQEKNLAYYGITLIPPESATLFISVFSQHDEEYYKELINLFKQAKSENKYIIHFGI